MTSPSFRFRPSARLQQFLGRELIADPNVAIVEFVKNAYDAGAAHVLVEFVLTESPTKLVIADDGTGMNETTFEANWMHPGFSEKAKARKLKPKDGDDPASRMAARTPVGEKGIGRLAAGRLGNVLDVYTRRARNQPWLHVHFDWDDFSNMDQALDAVKVPYDFDTPPPDCAWETGTVVEISDLSLRWEQMVRGRRVRGRRRTRLGRLRQDLEFLVRPQAADDFEVELRSDMVQDPEDVGKITPGVALQNADYSYTFSLSEKTLGEITVEREVRRSKESSELTGQPRRETLHSGLLDDAECKKEGRPTEILGGPFEGTFAYNPPPAEQRAKEIDESPVGVLLYRDGVMVEPYGVDENDWVGVRARKAQRQGHAAIQPDTFTGSVLISRGENSELRDQSNRLGLLVNSTSENFLAHVRAEFGIFERLVYAELLLATRWSDSKAEKAGRKASETQQRAQVFLRALAHSLRQPLSGLDWAMLSLEQLEQNTALPKEFVSSLSDVRHQGEGHLQVAEQLIRKFLDFAVPEFGAVEVRTLVSAAIGQVSELAEQLQVELETTEIPEENVLVPDQFVVQAVADIVANAIEAPRKKGRAPGVVISGDTRGGDVVLTVSDNGRGIQNVGVDTPLVSIESTKGRPAVGLRSAQMCMTAARGSVTLVETSEEGTRFEISLPTRVRGLSQNGTSDS